MRLYTSELVKKYKARTVVDHVSIDVNQGEIVGLLGPNGAGKTTTFYMIVGLIKPNEGRIFLEDDEGKVAELTKEPVYKRAQLGVGYLAQEASVFRRLSVEDNIRAVLEMTDFSKEYQNERVESLIEEFRLQKVRKSLGIQLSGGERRRTEIAPPGGLPFRISESNFLCVFSLSVCCVTYDILLSPDRLLMSVCFIFLR